MDLLDFKRNVFSQNGEDGILAKLFTIVGTTSAACCEFGASDGVTLSNVRALILDGWSALLIEPDTARFAKLARTYHDNPRVRCLRRFVRDGGELGALLSSAGLPPLDFLCIDIDGLDYYVMKRLSVRPRVLLVEVNAGHAPEATALLPEEVAANNVGQPLGAFTEAAMAMGYRLVAYNGNAFFLHENVIAPSIETLTPVAAYRSYLSHLEPAGRRWIYSVNRGAVPPFYEYDNPYLTASALGLAVPTVAAAMLHGQALRVYRAIRGS